MVLNGPDYDKSLHWNLTVRSKVGVALGLLTFKGLSSHDGLVCKRWIVKCQLTNKWPMLPHNSKVSATCKHCNMHESNSAVTPEVGSPKEKQTINVGCHKQNDMYAWQRWACEKWPSANVTLSVCLGIYKNRHCFGIVSFLNVMGQVVLSNILWVTWVWRRTNFGKIGLRSYRGIAINEGTRGAI